MRRRLNNDAQEMIAKEWGCPFFSLFSRFFSFFLTFSHFFDSALRSDLTIIRSTNQIAFFSDCHIEIYSTESVRLMPDQALCSLPNGASV